MENEPRDRLLAIRQQLEGVTSKDFWEIIDRGRNFEYMPPEQRDCMRTFFSWLSIGERTGASRANAAAASADAALATRKTAE
jgi:hypothetical protein